MRRRGEVIASDDAEGDMMEAGEARNDRTAKLKGGRVGESNEDVERSLGRLRGHKVVVRCMRALGTWREAVAWMNEVLNRHWPRFTVLRIYLIRSDLERRHGRCS